MIKKVVKTFRLEIDIFIFESITLICDFLFKFPIFRLKIRLFNSSTRFFSIFQFKTLFFSLFDSIFVDRIFRLNYPIFIFFQEVFLIFNFFHKIIVFRKPEVVENSPAISSSVNGEMTHFTQVLKETSFGMVTSFHDHNCHCAKCIYLK